MPDSNDPHRPDSPPGSTGGWMAPGSDPSGGSGAGAGGWNQGWAGPAGAPGMPPGGWRVPDAKPGVIALRPLGVGEIVDGAITTVRRNPAATLGLAAVVGAIIALVGLAASWFIVDQDILSDPMVTEDEALDFLATALPVTGIQLLFRWLATTVLTGLLTVVVGQAVIGRRLTVGAAWEKGRPRMWRLLGLTIVYTLIWLGAFIGVIVVSAILAGAAGSGFLVLIGFLGAVVLTAWLFVRYALAVPSLMLESESHGAATRPVRLGRALNRSAGLVRGTWWRAFGVLLLIFIIGWIISLAVNVPFQLVSGAALTDTTVPEISFGSMVLVSVGEVISTAIAAPFMAAATVLLYIDLRIRREGLDLELARAAGIDLPARGAGTGYGAPGYGTPGQYGAPGHPGQYGMPPGAPAPPPEAPGSPWTSQSGDPSADVPEAPRPPRHPGESPESPSGPASPPP